MLLVAERNLQETFRGEHVDRQAAVPEGDSEAQALLPLQINFTAIDRDFEDAFEGGLGHGLRIQQTKAPLFYGEFLHAAARELDHHGQFFGGANGYAKFGIFEFGESFREKINAHAQAILVESVTQLAQMENAAVHGAAAAL